MKNVLFLTMALAVMSAPAVMCETIKTDAPAYQSKGTVMVPMRAIFEWLGAEVSFDSATGVITARRNDQVVSLNAGSKTATVNGETKTMSASAESRNGRTFVPVRFVAEAFGAEVTWDALSKTVTVRQAGREGVLRIGAAAGTKMTGASGDPSRIALSKDKAVVIYSLPATFAEGTSVIIVKGDTGPRDIRFIGSIPLPGPDLEVGYMCLLPNLSITKTGRGDYTGIWSCPLYVREETHSPFNCERISIVSEEKIPLGHDWLQAGPGGARLLRKEGRKVILMEGSAFVIKNGAKQ